MENNENQQTNQEFQNDQKEQVNQQAQQNNQKVRTAEVVQTNEKEKKYNGVAIASFICGLVGLAEYHFPSGVAAIVTGIIGLVKFNEQKEKGKWMAITGIILGVLDILWSILILLIALGIFVTAIGTTVYQELKKLKELKKFIIFIASIGLIAIMIAIYFLFINDESQVPKNVQERDNVYIKEYGNRKVFAIDPAEKNENNKYILYFHGGAYIGGLENYHWNFIEKLSKETGYGIIIPDYPLAPKYTY